MSAKVSPEWSLNPGFGTQEKCPFPPNRRFPSVEVQRLCEHFSETKFCDTWMAVSLKQRCLKGEGPLYIQTDL